MIADVFQLLREADRLEHPFDMTADGFGHELCAIAAEEILANMDAQTDPDGNPWPALSETYREWKETVAPGQPIGVLYGHMKTPEQLAGFQEVRPAHTTHTYGIDELAVAEATKFQEGGAVTGTNQPERPFWGFTARAAERIDEAATRRLDAALP